MSPIRRTPSRRSALHALNGRSVSLTRRRPVDTIRRLKSDPRKKRIARSH
jgi:hypothetical protein